MITNIMEKCDGKSMSPKKVKDCVLPLSFRDQCAMHSFNCQSGIIELQFTETICVKCQISD